MRRRFRGNHSVRKLRKDSRTIPYYGEDEDAGILYRCWHCGFICNSDRDSLGDSKSRSGAIYEDYNPTENTVMRNMGVGSTGDQTTTYISEPDRSIYGSLAIGQKSAVLGGSVNSYTVAGEQDSAGDNRGVKHPIRVSNKSYGCPLCHSRNWRGDH